MRLPGPLLARTMNTFSIEKTLRTSDSFKSGGNECRLGTISMRLPDQKVCDGGSNSKQSYRTPMYLIHTQSGTVPHITPDVLDLIYPAAPNCEPIPPLQISIDSTFKFLEPVQKLGQSIGEFIGLPKIPTFLTVHDSLQLLKSGHNDKFGIALWSKHGRTSLTPERCFEVIDGFNSSCSQILSDYDLNTDKSGMKRLKKSLSRAEEYASFIVKEKETTSSKFDSGLFLTIEAVWFELNEELAVKTVTSLLESQHLVEGIVVSGLVDRFAKPGPITSEKNRRREGEPTKVKISKDLNLKLVEKIFRLIPPGLPKYVQGPFNLRQMVDLVSTGVDILDSCVTSRMADRAEAFLLDKLESQLSYVLPSLNANARYTDNETLPERDGNNDIAMNKNEHGGVISLKDKRFFDDFQPLSKSCTCYTCRKHTRSYVHHLYATDELLGPVLIQMHNLTALGRFFKIIRGAIEDAETLEKLHRNLSMLKQLLGDAPSESMFYESESMANKSMS